jgi:hypothetical protein
MSRSPGPHGTDPFAASPRTPGPLGHNDAADPNRRHSQRGDTPGPLGVNDHADPSYQPRHPSAGNHFHPSDEALELILHMPGWGKSALVWIAKECKRSRPFSAGLLQHYVGGSGDPLDLSEIGPIPEAWQDWIVKETGKKLGRQHLDPYHAKPIIPDLKNSLGHFDVIVSAKAGSAKRVYEIEKNPYRFWFKPHDVDRRGQHGFELQDWGNIEIEVLEHLLPVRTYRNPGGFSEGFQIKNGTLYIPQEVLSRAGKPFVVHGRFER